MTIQDSGEKILSYYNNCSNFIIIRFWIARLLAVLHRPHEVHKEKIYQELRVFLSGSELTKEAKFCQSYNLQRNLHKVLWGCYEILAMISSSCCCGCMLQIATTDRELICGMSKWHSCTCYHTCSHSPCCSCHQTTIPPKENWEQKFVNPKSCTIILWEKFVNPKSHTQHGQKFV